MSEFNIGDNAYQTVKLSAFAQLFIVRRLAKTVKALVTPELLKKITEMADSSGKKEGGDDLIDIIKTILDAFGNISDEDMQYVITECCKVTRRFEKTTKQYLPILTPNGAFMYADIDGVAYTKITYEVMRENLTSFFTEFRSIWG